MSSFLMQARRLIILLAIFASPGTAGSIEMPAVLSGKSTVKEIVSHFRGEMSVLIAQAGGESRVTLSHAFSLGEALIQSLSAAYADALDVTFEKLDQAQQKVFIDSWRLIESTKQSLNESVIADAVKTADNFNTVLLELAAWSSKPLVLSYSPNFIAPAHLSDEVAIRVNGFKLHTDDAPTLRVEGTEVRALGTNNSVVFVVDRKLFPQSEKKTRFARGEMKIIQTSTSWLKPWTKIWPERKEHTFGLMFTVLPEKMGTYYVSTKVKEEKTEEKDFVSRPPLRAVANGGSDVKRDCYTAEGEWTFDVNTAEVVPDEFLGWYKGNPDNRYNHGEYVFDDERYKDQAKTPKRICIKVSAVIWAKEDTARTTAHLKAKLKRTVYEFPKEEEPKVEELTWKVPLDLAIVADAESQTLTINLFDDYPIKRSLRDPGNEPFLSFNPDLRNKVLYVTPTRTWLGK